jgi:hypothetical protein
MPNATTTTTARLHHWARMRQGDKVARVTRISADDVGTPARFIVERPDTTFHVASTWREALAVASDSLATVRAVTLTSERK